MKIKNVLAAALLLLAAQIHAQMEPRAGNWKTWFIPSGNAYRLPPPPANKAEIAEVLARQKSLDSAGLQQIALSIEVLLMGALPTTRHSPRWTALGRVLGRVHTADVDHSGRGLPFGLRAGIVRPV